MTIGENMSLAVERGQSRGLGIATTKRRLAHFREILAPLQLGLEDRLNTLVGTLSGGQRQALALVMATISRPSVLLLDEHTAKLDPNTAGIVLKLTEDIVSNEKITAIMVTHNIREAVFLADRVLVLSPRPATVSAEFVTNLPRPRPKGIEYSQAFGELALKIRQAIRE